METVINSSSIILGQTILLFMGLTLSFAGTGRASYICRVISREVASYFLSFSPVALLVYLLYVASNRM